MKPAPTILVTGFGPYDGGVNASQVLVESLLQEPPEVINSLDDRVQYRILPVDTARIESLLLEMIEELNPDICMFTGQAVGRSRITIERLAVNLRDFEISDALGNSPQGEEIVPGGPVAYWSTVPDQAGLVDLLNNAAIPAAHSNHAGNHLCNQTLYLALHHAERSRPTMQSTFVHIPALPEQAAARPGNIPFMTLEMTRRAMAVMLCHLIGL